MRLFNVWLWVLYFSWQSLYFAELPVNAQAKPQMSKKAKSLVLPGDPVATSQDEDTGSSQKADELFKEGVGLLEKDDAEAARPILEQAAQLTPNCASIHCNLGLACQRLGDIHNALLEFETALKLVPNMPEALLDLGGCLQSIGSTTDAMNVYKRYLATNPSSPKKAEITALVETLRTRRPTLSSDPTFQDYYLSILHEGIYKWPKEKMPLKIFISDGTTSDGSTVEGYNDSFKRTLVDAFNAWSQASGGRVTFLLVPAQNLADIYCIWTSDPQEVKEEGETEGGSVKLIARDSNIVRATLKILTRPLNDQVNGQGSLSNDEVMKICLHEIGHVLGLGGHSNNNHDIMFYGQTAVGLDPTLSRRDKATISRLYDGYPKLASFH
jgi:hypothetical protein